MDKSFSDLNAYQTDLEDAFRLECSADDIKVNSEVRKLFKFIKKQRKRVNKFINSQKKNKLEGN